MYVLEWQYEGYNYHIKADESTVVHLADLFEEKSIRYWVMTKKNKTVTPFDYLNITDYPGWQF